MSATVQRSLRSLLARIGNVAAEFSPAAPHSAIAPSVADRDLNLPALEAIYAGAVRGAQAHDWVQTPDAEGNRRAADK